MKTSHLLLAIARAMPEGLITCDDRGAVRFSNAAAHDILGAEPFVSALDSIHTSEVGTALLRLGFGDSGNDHLRRARLVTSTGVLRLVICGSRRDRFVTFMLRREVLREGELLTALTAELGISSIEARAIVRAYRGMGNEAIAASFNVSVATIKSRLHRVYRRLAIRSRSDLLPIIDRVVRSRSIAGAAPRSVAPDGTIEAHEPAEGTAAWRALARFFEAADFGIVALDRSGNQMWSNPRAAFLLGSRGWDKLRDSARRRPLPAHVFVDDLHPRVDLQLFPLDDGRIGSFVHQRRLRGDSLRALLCERFQLTDRQAEIAVLIAAGSSTIEIAADTGLAEVSVRSATAVLSEKLGVRGRAELTTLLARIAEE